MNPIKWLLLKLRVANATRHNRRGPSAVDMTAVTTLHAKLDDSLVRLDTVLVRLKEKTGYVPRERLKVVK